MFSTHFVASFIKINLLSRKYNFLSYFLSLHMTLTCLKIIDSHLIEFDIINLIIIDIKEDAVDT